jgi:hypothetical protein
MLEEDIVLGVKRQEGWEGIPNGRPFAYYLGKGDHDKATSTPYLA